MLPSPKSLSLKKEEIASDQAPIQLKSFANDCQERIRVLQSASDQARTAATNPHLTSVERWAILDELRHLVRPVLDNAAFADHKASEVSGLQFIPADNLSDTPRNALGTAQLAQLFGMDDRNVRRAFERAMRDNLPGFYWTGSQWRADPEAFAREVSELCPRARRKLHCANDKADHP